MLQVEHCLASAWAMCFARSSRGAFAPRVSSPRAMPTFAPSTCPQTGAPSNSSKQVYDAKESLPSSGLGLLLSASLVGLSDVHLVPGPCAWFTAPPVGFSAATFGFGAPRAGPWPLLYSIELRVVLYVLQKRVWVRATPHLNLPG